MSINSVSTTQPLNSDNSIPSESKPPSVENKTIKNLYGDQSKADMLSNYMSRMNTFYSSVENMIDQKNLNSVEK
jgi:hypothetical protein